MTEAKSLLKEALQAEVGLPVDKSVPLIGFIGRLEEQKGSDILVEAIAKFIDQNVQIIVLVSALLNFSCPFLILLPKQSYANYSFSFYFREPAKRSWRSKLSSWR